MGGKVISALVAYRESQWFESDPRRPHSPGCSKKQLPSSGAWKERVARHDA